jgi:hypothetical protein
MFITDRFHAKEGGDDDNNGDKWNVEWNEETALSTRD